jgi:hypothetical protein
MDFDAQGTDPASGSIRGRSFRTPTPPQQSLRSPYLTSWMTNGVLFLSRTPRHVAPQSRAFVVVLRAHRGKDII